MRSALQIISIFLTLSFIPILSGCIYKEKNSGVPPNIYAPGITDSFADKSPGDPLVPLEMKKDFSLLKAVQYTLIMNPSIRISKESLEAEKGNHQSAAGEFGWELSGNTRKWNEYIPMTDAEKKYYTARGYHGDDFYDYDKTSVSVGLNKKLRTGPIISQTATIQRTENAYTDPERASRGQVAFKVDIPLLKGRGAVSAAAGETSAGVLVDAATLEVVFQSAQSVKEVTSLYWSYLSSFKQYELALESEKRANKLLEDTRLTVEAEYRPKSVLNKLEANLEDKKARAIQKKYAVQNIKNSLALAMGMEVSMFPSLSAPATPFPDISLSRIRELVSNIGSAAGKALESRWDYLAQKKRTQASLVQLEAARQDLMPRLNLGFTVGYRALNDQDEEKEILRGVYENSTDLEWETRLAFTMDIGNDKAKGRVRRTLGIFKIETLKEETLANRIRSEVLLSLESLMSYEAELAASREAVRLYEKAREDEYAKLSLGYATLLDVMDTEDRLSQANERMVSAMAQLSQAVANLKFSQGTLFVPKGNDLTVTYQSLSMLGD